MEPSQLYAAAIMSQNTGVSADLITHAEHVTPALHREDARPAVEMVAHDGDGDDDELNGTSARLRRRKRARVDFAPPLVGMAVPEERGDGDDVSGAYDYAAYRPAGAARARRAAHTADDTNNDNDDDDDQEDADDAYVIKRRKRTNGTPFPSVRDAVPETYRERPELRYMLPRSDGYNIVPGRENAEFDTQFEPAWVRAAPRDAVARATYDDMAARAKEQSTKMRLLSDKYMDHLHIRREILEQTPLHYLVMVSFAGVMAIENEELLMKQDFVANAIESIKSDIKAKIEQFEQAAKRAEMREVHLSKNLATLRQEMAVWTDIKTSPLLQGPSLVKSVTQPEFALWGRYLTPVAAPAPAAAAAAADDAPIVEFCMYTYMRMLAANRMLFMPPAHEVVADTATWLNPALFVEKFATSQVQLVDQLTGSANLVIAADMDAEAEEDEEEDDVVLAATTEATIAATRATCIVLLILWNSEEELLYYDLIEDGAYRRFSDLFEGKIDLCARLWEFYSTYNYADRTPLNLKDDYTAAFQRDASVLDVMNVDSIASMEVDSESAQTVRRAFRRLLIETMRKHARTLYPRASFNGTVGGIRGSPLARYINRIIGYLIRRELGFLDASAARSSGVGSGSRDDDEYLNQLLKLFDRIKAKLTSAARRFASIYTAEAEMAQLEHGRQLDLIKAADAAYDLKIVDTMAASVGHGISELLDTPFSADAISWIALKRPDYEPIVALHNRLWQLAQTALATRRTALALNVSFRSVNDTNTAPGTGDAARRDTASTRQRRPTGGVGGSGSSSSDANGATDDAADNRAADAYFDAGLSSATGALAAVPYESVANLSQLHQILLDLDRRQGQRMTPYLGHYTALGEYVAVPQPLQLAYADLTSFMMATGLRMGAPELKGPKASLLFKWILDLSYEWESGPLRALMVSKGTDLINAVLSMADISIYELAGLSAMFYLTVTRDAALDAALLQRMIDGAHWSEIMDMLVPRVSEVDVKAVQTRLAARATELTRARADASHDVDPLFLLAHPLQFIAQGSAVRNVEHCLALFKYIIPAVRTYKLHVRADARLAISYTLIAMELVQCVLTSIGEAIALSKTDMNARLTQQVELAKHRVLSTKDADERERLEADLREVIIRGRDQLDPTKTGHVLYSSVVREAFNQAEAWVRTNAPVLMADRRMAAWQWTSLIADMTAARSDFAALFVRLAAAQVTDARYRKNSVVQTSINTRYHLDGIDQIRQQMARFVLPRAPALVAYPVLRS